tara:strand:- start:307 stop:1524 length:1218 start_codon:yes stop_codon:yes gene_type:complete
MSFLSDYREFSKGSEAHPTYHTFSALVALSSIISRRVWVEMGYFKVYPNLYVVLVGPPGNRKTSAMSIAKSLIRELKDVPFSAECVTKEKLILDMAEQERAISNIAPAYEAQKVYTPMTIMVTELSEFLGMGSIGMINFLTTIYDQDVYEHRTKNRGEVLITGPFLNLLACTTPDWITTYLRADVISGGFSRRAIFVLETGKAGRIPFPEVTPEARAAWERVVAYSRRLQTLHGPFVWHPEAKAFYTDWYNNHKMPTEETVVGYYETKHMQLLKISMLIALSESPELILRKSHLEFGFALLRLAEENLNRVFEGIGRNELNGAASKVMDLLTRLEPRELTIGGTTLSVPWMFEKQLHAAMFRVVDQMEMSRVLQHLVDSDKVGRVTPVQGTPKPIIYLKPKSHVQ